MKAVVNLSVMAVSALMGLQSVWAANDIEVWIYDPDHPQQGYSCGSIDAVQYDGAALVLNLRENCTPPPKEEDQSDDGGDTDGGTDDGGGGTGLVCVDSDQVKCMGTDAELNTGGTIKHIDIAPDGIQVWEFTYQSRSALEQFYSSDSPTDSNVIVEFTINRNAGSMDAEDPDCMRMKTAISITALTRYDPWACKLEEGQSYFLNVHNTDTQTVGAYYTLTR